MRKWIVPLTIVCVISGLLLSLQIRLQNSITSNPTDQKSDILVSLVNNLESEIATYESQLSELRTKIETLSSNASPSEEEVDRLSKSLQTSQQLAGLTALEGPGIIVTLDDNAAGLSASPNDDPNKYIVHYENILTLISELKYAGAEAISLNGQRIVSNSEIRCVGNVILVNTTRLAPPFEIKGIGDPDRLTSVIGQSDEYNLLKSSGFPISYTKVTNKNPLIEIPAYTGSYPLKYLKADKE